MKKFQEGHSYPVEDAHHFFFYAGLAEIERLSRESSVERISLEVVIAIVKEHLVKVHSEWNMVHPNTPAVKKEEMIDHRPAHITMESHDYDVNRLDFIAPAVQLLTENNDYIEIDKNALKDKLQLSDQQYEYLMNALAALTREIQVEGRRLLETTVFRTPARNRSGEALRIVFKRICAPEFSSTHLSLLKTAADQIQVANRPMNSFARLTGKNPVCDTLRAVGVLASVAEIQLDYMDRGRTIVLAVHFPPTLPDVPMTLKIDPVFIRAVIRALRANEGFLLFLNDEQCRVASLLMHGSTVKDMVNQIGITPDVLGQTILDINSRIKQITRTKKPKAPRTEKELEGAA